MEQLANLEYYYRVFMKMHLASQVNEYLKNCEGLDLKKIDVFLQRIESKFLGKDILAIIF
jgi:hypothetical protein